MLLSHVDDHLGHRTGPRAEAADMLAAMLARSAMEAEDEAADAACARVAAKKPKASPPHLYIAPAHSSWHALLLEDDDDRLWLQAFGDEAYLRLDGLDVPPRLQDPPTVRVKHRGRMVAPSRLVPVATGPFPAEELNGPYLWRLESMDRSRLLYADSIALDLSPAIEPPRVPSHGLVTAMLRSYLEWDPAAFSDVLSRFYRPAHEGTSPHPDVHLLVMLHVAQVARTVRDGMEARLFGLDRLATLPGFDPISVCLREALARGR